MNRWGAWKIAGGQLMRISRRLRDLEVIGAVPFFGMATGTFRDKYLVGLGDSTLAGIQYPILVYDTILDYWTVWQIKDFKPRSFSEFIDNNGDYRLYMGLEKTLSGDLSNVYRFGGLYSDAGREIQMEYQTGQKLLGDPRTSALIKEIVTLCDNTPKSPIEVWAIFDDRDPVMIGEIQSAIQVFKIDLVRATRIELLFKEISKQESRSLQWVGVYGEPEDVAVVMEKEVIEGGIRLS
jgi:hypothetical protein